MAPTIKAVTEPVKLGEGPHWSHDHKALFFVSIYDKTIHKYDPATGRHTRSKFDDMPGFIIPVEGTLDRFVVGLKRNVVEVQWDGQDGSAKVVRLISEIDEQSPENQINDAKADPRGRLFVGTIGPQYEPGKFQPKMGSLYRIDAAGKTDRLVENLDLSNGMCWDLAAKAFYYADSFEYAIRRYDYNVETGDISNLKIIFRHKEHGLDGVVDGMTIDTDGNLWAAMNGGSRVIKIDPKKGVLLEKVPTPALKTTSVTFGGPALNVLYVTSGAMNSVQEQLPPCGSTFEVTGLGVRGHPNVCVKLN